MTPMISRPRPGNRLTAILIALALCVPLFWQATSVFAVPSNDVDLSVSVDNQPNVVVAGRNLAFQVHTHNFGPDTAHGVKVTLDTGSPVLRYAASTNQANVTCVQTNATVITCTFTNNFASGANLDFTVLTNVYPNAFITLHDLNPNAIEFQTTAVISSDAAQDIEGDPNDNTDSVTTKVKELANLRIRKIVDPSVPLNTDFTYTIRVDNLGPSYARGVIIDDNTIGTGNFQVKTVVDDTARSDSCTITPGFGTQTMDSQITCALGDALEPIGDFSHPVPTTNTGRWKIRATMNSAVANQLDNIGQVFTRLTVTADCAPGVILPCPGTPDPRVENNSTSARVNIGGGSTDLQAFAVFGAEVQTNGLHGNIFNSNVGTPMPDPACCNFGGTTATAGRRVQWNFTALNAGKINATNVTISVLFPEGTQLIENTLTGLPAPFTSAQGRCFTQPAGGNRVRATCVYDLLGPAGVTEVPSDIPEQARMELLVLLDPDIDPGNQMSIDATVTGDQPDSNPENNIAGIQFDTNSWADLNIVKAPLGPNPWPAGSLQSINYSVKNAGPSQARNVEFVDNLGPNLIFKGAFNANCNVDATNQLRCLLGDMDPSAVATVVSVDVQVKPSAANGALIQSGVTVSSDTPDPFLADNTSTPAAKTVAASADLAISINPVTGGWVRGPVIYNVKTTNNGPSGASGIVVTFNLPTNKGINAISYPSNCSLGGSTVTCNLLPLAPGASNTLQIQITPTIAGTLNASASVSATQFDPDLSNNSANVSTIISNPFPF